MLFFNYDFLEEDFPKLPSHFKKTNLNLTAKIAF